MKRIFAYVAGREVGVQGIIGIVGPKTVDVARSVGAGASCMRTRTTTEIQSGESGERCNMIRTLLPSFGSAGICNKSLAKRAR